MPAVITVPFTGSRRGRKEVGAFFASMLEQQEPLSFEVSEYVAHGDKVVALGRYSWRVKSTGRTFHGDWAHVFTLRNGQIVRLREYTDTANAAAAYEPA